MMFKTSASPLALLVLLALPTPALSQIPAREPELDALSSRQVSAFAWPDGVSWGTTIRLDGDPSLAPTNRILEQGFNQAFPGASLQVEGQGSEQAIQNLQDGNIDIAAIGRQLTRQERARGLVAVPVSRHKIAIIIGPENPFAGSLTNQQFAQIFRGEITDWSEVGGEAGEIRLIDRPEESNTRQAFAQYPAFQTHPFQATESAIQVNDHTDDVIKALGTDGIGYAIVDQVSERPDLKIVPLHNVLPNDSRYAFSQSIAYVYQGPVASPAAQAFLGYASTVSQTGGLAANETAAVALGGAGEVPGDRPGPLAGNGTVGLIGPHPQEVNRNRAVIGSTVNSTASPTADSTEGSVTEAAPVLNEAQQEAEKLQLDRGTPLESAANRSRSGKGWWWLLLPLAIIPFLLRWMMQRQSNGFQGGLQGELQSEAGLDMQPGTAGGLSGAATTFHRRVIPQVVFVPRDCHHAYAYWELPETVATRAARFGTLKLRLYDLSAVVTGDRPFRQYDCQGSDLQIPIRHDNHEYQVELGYLSHEGEWYRVAESDAVLVPACAIQGQSKAQGLSPRDRQPLHPQALQPRSLQPQPAFAQAQTEQARSEQARRDKTWITLVPLSSHQAQVNWHISQAHLHGIEAQGGKTLMMKVHDADHIDLDLQPPHSTQTYMCEVGEETRMVELPHSDRDYVAEIGYLTEQQQWLRVARSIHSHSPTPDYDGCRIVIMPCDPHRFIYLETSQEAHPQAYVYWDISEERRQKLRQQGGRILTLRIHDADSIDLDHQTPHQTDEYMIDEQARDKVVAVIEGDRDYVAEIGYRTLEGKFLSLGRSVHARIPQSKSTSS